MPSPHVGGGGGSSSSSRALTTLTDDDTVALSVLPKIFHSADGITTTHSNSSAADSIFLLGIVASQRAWLRAFIAAIHLLWCSGVPLLSRQFAVWR